jgi:hypothetical protein
MTSLRLAVPTVLVAAALAGCITYFVAPAPPQPQPIEAGQRLPPTVPNVTGRPASGISTNIQRPSTEDHIDAFQRAAEAILKRAQNATAAASEPLVTGPIPLVTGPIPLPRRRPIPRP